MNEQESFWRDQYADSYREKNQSFNRDLGVAGWQEMIRRAEGVETVLECGSNIGRNIGFLETCLPKARMSLIELSPDAYRVATAEHRTEHSFNGSIVDSKLPSGHFDLVFTCGVLTLKFFSQPLSQSCAQMKMSASMRRINRGAFA